MSLKGKTSKGKFLSGYRPIQNAPLRKVVGYKNVEVCGVPIPREVLECGHIQAIPCDLLGETIAARRRCKQCTPTKTGGE